MAQPTEEEVRQWLAHCPSWCEEVQCHSELPADRRHQSAPLSIPVVLLAAVGAIGVEIRKLAIAAELDIALFQRHPDDYVWLSLGTDDRTLEVSLESAAQLQLVMARVLGWTS